MINGFVLEDDADGRLSGFGGTMGATAFDDDATAGNPSTLRVSREVFREWEGELVKDACGKRVDFGGRGGEEFFTGGDDASPGWAT